MRIIEKQVKQLQQILFEFEEKTEIDLFFLYGLQDPIILKTSANNISALTQLMRSINDLYKDDVIVMDYPLVMTLEYNFDDLEQEIEITFFIKEQLRLDLRKLLMR